MGDDIKVSMAINRRPVTHEVRPQTLLVDFIRDHCGLTGTHIGCDEGLCGACTVSVDGDVVKSCMMLAVEASDADVTTVEGLANGEQLNHVQQSFVDRYGLQCGYCTPGMLMSANDLLQRNPTPCREDVLSGMAGNYCRCTGYKSVIDSVMHAGADRGTPQGCHAEGDAATSCASDCTKLVGRSMPRKEDRRLVMGAGEFTDDFRAPGQLYCAILRSTEAHARIRGFDVSVANTMPGVVRVVTGQEAAHHWNSPFSPTMGTFEDRTTGCYPMAVDVVRFVGEPVAAVVAENRYQARAAADAILVQYEALPVVANLKDAGDNADAAAKAVLYESWDDNRQIVYDWALGDVDAAFHDADLVVEDVLTSHRWGPVPLEMRVVHADYRPSDKKLTVRLSTQIPHQDRTQISRMLGLPEGSIRVIAGDVGGSFGAKLSTDVEYIPVLMSILTGRPVNYCDTRQEWLTSGTQAHDFIVTISAAFAADGRLLGVRNRTVADMGADGGERAMGMAMPIVGAIYAPGPYLVPAYSFETAGFVTNKAPYGAYRGYGKDIANVTLERVFDQAATRLGVDPLELRRRNMLTSYPHQMISGPVVENGSVHECLDKLEQLVDLPAFRQRQAHARAEGRYLGIGLVPYIEPSGGGVPWSIFNGYDSARIRMTPDGTVQVFSGAMQCGQGIQTNMAQVTADRLGCAYDAVSVFCGDTDTTPYGMGAYGSRGTVVALGAVAKAVDALREKVLVVGSYLLEHPPADLELAGGAVYVRADPELRVTLDKVADAAFLAPGGSVSMPGVDNPTLEAISVYVNPHVTWDPDEHGRVNEFAAHATGAQAALVEVDVKTGFVTVDEIVVVGDVGVVINPMALEGQIVGGVVQAFAGSLLEDHAYDDNAVPRHTTLRDYGYPSIRSAPPVRVEHIETPGTTTVIGAKGAGEGGQIATFTSIMSAVEDALSPYGVHVDELPLAPWRVLELLDRAESRAHPPSPLVGSTDSSAGARP